MPRPGALSLAVCVCVFAVPDAGAQEAEAVADQRNWALQVTPYVWAAGLSGKVSPFRRGPTLSVDKSFSDVMRDLNVGGFINVYGRHGRLIFLGDVMYVDTTGSHTTGPLHALTPGALPGVVLKGSANTKQFMATAQAGYRLVESENFTLDAVAGVRYWHISNKVKVSALTASRSYKENFGWVDPVIGARAFFRLTDDLSLQAQADVGGFSLGAKQTWSAMATLNYTFTKQLSVSAGYKALGVNYRRGGHVYDTLLSGPVLGLTYRF